MDAELAAIGIDIGGSRTKVGLVSASGELLESQTLPSHLSGDPEPFLSAVYTAVERYRSAPGVSGIGIALCSLINEEHTGASLSVNAPALNRLNLKALFEKRFDCPVGILNDVNAYALAEYHFGAGRGAKRLLCLAAGTGVAIAVLIDGGLVETWGGVAADAARIVLEPAAEVVCNGNVRGSAEALCGTAHIVRLAQREYGRHDVTAHEVIAASSAGNDPIAGRIMAQIGGHIGHLLALLSPVFFPHCILVTGGTAEAGDALFRAIRERYAALIGDYMAGLIAIETGAARPVHIRKGALGPEAAVIGAATRMLAS